MIVKILARGSSFKGLATYLTHDPKDKTDARVAWTHTLNLAHDHVPSAVDEMLWTARNAELLKQEAGVRAGGRATEDPVKHLSLNWAPEDAPSRGHMIAATEDFLRHMKWEDHQALLVAHDDKAHAHVHVMLNVVHPETGLRLDDGFERRRAQAWALDYEREQGRIHCKQRLLDSSEREDAPTRPAWMAFAEKQREFEKDEKARRAQEPIYVRDPEMPENAQAAEWKALKELQRQERIEFFLQGKSEFKELRNSIYHEVRDEFRDRWRDYFAARGNGDGSDNLEEMKAKLVAEQKTALDGRRDAACLELRKERDGTYRELLDEQRAFRLGLHWRQDADLAPGLFVQAVADRHADEEIAAAFQAAAAQTTGRPAAEPWEADDTAFSGGRTAASGLKSEAAIGFSVGTGLGLGLIDFFGSIADGMTGSTPAPVPRHAPEPPKADPFEAVIEQARERQKSEQEEAERNWRQMQRGAYGE